MTFSCHLKTTHHSFFMPPLTITPPLAHARNPPIFLAAITIAITPRAWEATLGSTHMVMTEPTVSACATSFILSLYLFFISSPYSCWNWCFFTMDLACDKLVLCCALEGMGNEYNCSSIGIDFSQQFGHQVNVLLTKLVAQVFSNIVPQYFIWLRVIQLWFAISLHTQSMPISMLT